MIIDRFDRRKILMVAQLGVMAVAAAFAIFVATGIIDKWSILVLVAIYGTIMAFIFPTRTAIVPNLVERSDLANAVALNAAGQNATRVFGPTIAGVLIATLGVAETFAIAAVMQILALFATSRLPSIPSKISAGAMSGWKSLDARAAYRPERCLSLFDGHPGAGADRAGDALSQLDAGFRAR